IDFGTSHTVAMCQWGAGSVYPLLFDASPLLPSAVLATDSRLLVGRDAERGARTDPAAFEPYPKRRVDDGTILLGSTEHSVVEVIAAVLRRCLDGAVRVAGGGPARGGRPSRWCSPIPPTGEHSARRCWARRPCGPELAGSPWFRSPPLRRS